MTEVNVCQYKNKLIQEKHQKIPIAEQLSTFSRNNFIEFDNFTSTFRHEGV